MLQCNRVGSTLASIGMKDLMTARNAFIEISPRDSSIEGRRNSKIGFLAPGCIKDLLSNACEYIQL
jgi:hypothetical protein